MIYDFEEFLFSLLMSNMHNIWMKSVCGSLETRIRYSNTLCYNTFPVPELTDLEKSKLNDLGNAIIRERIMAGGTLAELYDKKKMPDSLRKVHSELDDFVDSLYLIKINRNIPFKSDIERLEVLFKLYAQSKEA